MKNIINYFLVALVIATTVAGGISYVVKSVFIQKYYYFCMSKVTYNFTSGVVNGLILIPAENSSCSTGSFLFKVEKSGVKE